MPEMTDQDRLDWHMKRGKYADLDKSNQDNNLGDNPAGISHLRDEFDEFGGWDGMHGNFSHIGGIYHGGVRNTDDVFSGGVDIIDQPKIYLPTDLLDLCVAIQKRVGSNEFSILLKGEWRENGFYTMHEQGIVVPKQDVSAGLVDYKEPLAPFRQKGWHVVIHSHPGGHSTGSFSGTDDQYINSFFPCSVLFTGTVFATATLIFDIPKGYARFEAETVTYRMANTEIPAQVITDIDSHIKKPLPVSKHDYVRGYGTGFGKDVGARNAANNGMTKRDFKRDRNARINL